jgi:hypothetical protein
MRISLIVLDMHPHDREFFANHGQARPHNADPSFSQQSSPTSGKDMATFVHPIALPTGANPVNYLAHVPVHFPHYYSATDTRVSEPKHRYSFTRICWRLRMSFVYASRIREQLRLTLAIERIIIIIITEMHDRIPTGIRNSDVQLENLCCCFLTSTYSFLSHSQYLINMNYSNFLYNLFSRQ